MSWIYRSMQATKQNIYKRIELENLRREEQEQLLMVIYRVRKDHPAMGKKMLYKKLNPEMGRDRFYIWYRLENLTVRPKKNWRRTTDSSGVIRFSNLTLDIELTGVNQLWVSDITYYEIGEEFYFLTFIMDQYSRKIKGHSVSKTLKTEHTTIPALLIAMKDLQIHHKPIFHSDGGGQYYSKEFLALTKERFSNSMGKSAYENPYAERLNRTIKNDYIKYYSPQNFIQLKQMTSKAVSMYNSGKPHGALAGRTPNQFENELLIKKQLNSLAL